MDRLDDKLDALFRSLPRERASSDFTQRLLLRVGEARHKSRRGRRLLFVAVPVTAVAAVCITSFAWFVHERAERERMRAEYAAIQDEYDRLLAQHDHYERDLVEFTAFRLGGDRDSELVLDLSGLEAIETVEDVPVVSEGKGGPALPETAAPFSWPQPLELNGGTI